MIQMRGFIGLLMFGALGLGVPSETPAGFVEVSPGDSAQVRGGKPYPNCTGYNGTAERCCTGSMNKFNDVYVASTTTTTAKPSAFGAVCGPNTERMCTSNSYVNGIACN